MIDTKKVEQLIREGIAAEGAFLVDYEITSGNVIKVEADHMEGMSIDHLTKISRHIEHNLDREQEDFEIEVSSPGVGLPFKVRQQYEKNVGHLVKVTLNDGQQLLADLVAFSNDEITLKWEERVPKEKGKGKMKVEKMRTIPLNEIKETRVEIRF